MSTPRLGKLSPRYTFILNKYPDQRLSKCPKCEKLTHPRKFALFVHVHGYGPLALGKTCTYCAKCELVIAHKHEIESEIESSMSILSPESVGKDYLVMGTIEPKVWKRGLGGKGQPTQEILDALADWKEVLDLHVQPAGWYKSGS